MKSCDHHLCRIHDEKTGARECCKCGEIVVPKKIKVHVCKGCGYPIDPSEDFCGECLCEDDCAPD